MIRIVIMIVLLVHGLIHLIGFVVPWRLATIEGMPYKTTLLAGGLNVGDTGIRVVGLLWLLLALGFVVGAVGVSTGQPWWRMLTLAVTLFSLVVTLLGLPDSPFGVMINLIILGYLLVGDRLAWLPQLP
jgi:hypothetical protein